MTDLLPVADTLDALSKLIRTPAPAAPISMPMLEQTAVERIKGFIEQKEGLLLTAKLTPQGKWSVGYGHDGPPAGPGVTLTQWQADTLFAMDLLKFANAIAPLLTLIPVVGQYEALISFAFNLGEGALKTSHLLKYHNAGNFQAAADEFPKWDHEHINGVLVEVPGLLARRQQERAIYLGQG